MTPLVSVIVPAWNCAAFLNEALASVDVQSFSAWELIIVDDGSTDATLEIARRFADARSEVTTVLTQVNRGPSAARSTGAGAVKPSSRYLYFLDADDVLEPHALATLVTYMEQVKHISLLHFDCCCIDQSGTPLNDADVDYTPIRIPRYVPHGLSARKLTLHETKTPFVSIYNLAGIIPSLVFLRREAFDSCGGWDPTFKQGFEDTDLWLRMALEGEVHYLPQKLVRYRRHPSQWTTAAGVNEFGDRYGQLLRKWGQGEWLNSEQRRIVSKAEAFRLGGLAVYKNLALSKKNLMDGNFTESMRFTYGALRALLRMNG